MHVMHKPLWFLVEIIYILKLNIIVASYRQKYWQIRPLRRKLFLFLLYAYFIPCGQVSWKHHAKNRFSPVIPFMNTYRKPSSRHLTLLWCRMLVWKNWKGRMSVFTGQHITVSIVILNAEVNFRLLHCS